MFIEFTKIKKETRTNKLCVCVYITLLNTLESAGKRGNSMD